MIGLEKSKKKRGKRSRRMKTDVNATDVDICILCGRKIKDSDIKIMVGGYSRYAHMECIAKYQLNMLRR